MTTEIIQCPIPPNEADRLQAVRAYDILDSQPEVDFDTFKSIIEKTESHIPKNKNTNEVIIKLKLDDNYYGLITQLQEKIEYEFLKETIIMDIEDKKNLEKENITDE